MLHIHLRVGIHGLFSLIRPIHYINNNPNEWFILFFEQWKVYKTNLKNHVGNQMARPLLFGWFCTLKFGLPSNGEPWYIK